MATIAESIVGHDKQKQLLLSMVNDQSLPFSFIFYGNEGVGKKLLVRGLLQILVCKEATLACGICSNCTRVVEDKNEFIYEVGLEKKKTISVDQIRDLHKFLSLKTLKSERFVLIDPADRLSTAASNSLLKVLEEPPEGTYFFLITSKLSSLLPTIRSRSQIMRFEKLKANEISQISGVNQTAVDWAGGRYDYAQQLLEEETINYLNDSLNLFYSLLCTPAQDWKKMAPWFFSNDQWQDFCFHVWFQALEKRINGQVDNLEWIPEDSSQIAHIFDKVEDFRSDISRNVDKLLAMENFYYKVQGEQGASAWS